MTMKKIARLAAYSCARPGFALWHMALTVQMTTLVNG